MDKQTDSKKSNNIRALNTFLIQYFHIVIMFLILVFVLISVFFLLKPKYDNIQRGIEVSNDNKKKEKEALTTYDGRLDGYISSFEKIRSSNKEKVSGLLPSGDMKEGLFVQFEEMTKKRGLLLKSLTINEIDVEEILNPKPNARKVVQKNAIKLPEGVGTVEISIDVVGLGYTEFKNFLQTIEKNLRIMDITTLNYDNSGKTLSLSITTYFNYFDRLKK